MSPQINVSVFTLMHYFFKVKIAVSVSMNIFVLIIGLKLASLLFRSFNSLVNFLTIHKYTTF
jgi:hypothetical protein